MSNNNKFLPYDQLQKLLDDHQYLITVSELQGLLMGFYAAGLPSFSLSWKQLLMKQLSVSEPMPEVIENELVAINVSLCESINGQLFGLQLLLPDDDCSTITRAEALGYWCQGFLLGYMQVTENKEETDEDVADSLADLEEISNIDLDSVGNSEEDEKSLFEITEHIKVAAQMIHSVNGQNPANDDKTFH